MNEPLMTPAEVSLTRRALGMTLEELAKQVGVHKSTVGSWESGQHAIGADAVNKLNELVAEQGKLVAVMRKHRSFKVPRNSDYLKSAAMIAMLADNTVTVNWSDTHE